MRCVVALVAMLAASKPAAAPSLSELENMRYSLGSAGDVTLVHGRDQPASDFHDSASRRTVSLARGFRVAGDLDGDGHDEAVVMLSESTGGSGTFDYLAVVGRRNGAPVNLATTPLGDRVQLRGVRIEARRLIAEVVRAGPQDAMCCPGELATLEWVMKDSKLDAVASGIAPTRLSLAAISGVDWTLDRWTWDEAVPKGISVTLRVDTARVTGLAACNRYVASATEGSSPGEVSIGAAATTRLACPAGPMQAEQRFLEQLGGVTRYSFVAGQLALSWSANRRSGTMLFERGAKPP
jgi:heat shock protein HslJ